MVSTSSSRSKQHPFSLVRPQTTLRSLWSRGSFGNRERTSSFTKIHVALQSRRAHSPTHERRAEQTVNLLSRALCLVICLVFPLARTALCQYVVAQFLPPTINYAYGFASGSHIAGQTFTPLEAGQLETVTMALAPQGPPLPPLGPITVELCSTSNGLPSTILATSIMDGSSVTGDIFASYSMVTADFFSSDVTLNPGTMYAFTLNLSSGGLFLCGATPASSYPGGIMVDSPDSGVDWETAPGPAQTEFVVTAIPEPSSLALLVLAALVLAAPLTRREFRHRQIHSQ